MNPEVDSDAVFEYVLPAVIQSLFPSRGYANQQAIVTVKGKNFAPHPESACRFGDVTSARISWVSSSVIVCTVPPLPIGNVSVAVSNEGYNFL